MNLVRNAVGGWSWPLAMKWWRFVFPCAMPALVLEPREAERLALRGAPLSNDRLQSLDKATRLDVRASILRYCRYDRVIVFGAS